LAAIIFGKRICLLRCFTCFKCLLLQNNFYQADGCDVVATFSYYNLCRSIVLLHRKEHVSTTQSSYFPPPTKTSN